MNNEVPTVLRVRKSDGATVRINVADDDKELYEELKPKKLHDFESDSARTSGGSDKGPVDNKAAAAAAAGPPADTGSGEATAEDFLTATVPEITQALEDVKDKASLKALHTAEKKGANRQGVLTAIEKRMESLK